MTSTEMLSITNSNVETSEPNSWHLFYDNSKYEEKYWYSHIVFGSINCYDSNLVTCIRSLNNAHCPIIPLTEIYQR